MEGFWPLGGLLGDLFGHLGPSWSLLEHLGSHLEASCAILSHLGGYLGLSEALLEPSWAILDALTARGTPCPGPGEGVGGGVNPSPKGKKGIGRGSSLDHRCPKGLLGLERERRSRVRGPLWPWPLGVSPEEVSSGTPCPGQWGGVRGGVNPSPKGKKGVGRGNSLDHLRPKGLVGFYSDADDPVGLLA